MDAFIPLLPVAVPLAGILAGLIMWSLMWFFPRRAEPACPPPHISCFLLHQDRIIDIGDDASGELAELESWSDLRKWLGPRFPGLPKSLSNVGADASEQFFAAEETDSAVVSIMTVSDRHRVTLSDPYRPSPAEWHSMRCNVASGRVFSAISAIAPLSICTLDKNGAILWCNARFGSFSDRDAKSLIDAVPEADDMAGQTARLVSIGNRHYEITVDFMEGRRVLFADNFTRLVHADTARSTFIQTLTKTFADLATGLAVFDRNRRLVLFNPAIIDLTGLSAAFLSGRPGLREFFDRLRDMQVLPEPRDYATWQTEISEKIDSASDGYYAETWTLPSGLTYRVSGRPHPDGAVAFLFEDISDEMSLTRESRTQFEMRQAMLDRLDEAVAVIGADGVLVCCNAACRKLLDFDPDNQLAETGFDELLSVCRSRFSCPKVWDDVAGCSGRNSFRRRIETHLPTGPEGPARCRVEPLPGGFTMLILSPLPQVEPA